MPMSGTYFTPAEIDLVALTASAEVTEALAALQTAYDRWREAAARENELRALAQQAPHADIDAVMQAVTSGASKLPEPTASRAAEAHAEAERLRDACERLALQAEDHARDTIASHRDELRAAANHALEVSLDRVDEALAALRETMEFAGMCAARVIQVGSEDRDPLTAPQPVRWNVYDGRLDANVDGVVGLLFIAEAARAMRPSVMREQQEPAPDSTWTEPAEYLPHRLPDGSKVRVRRRA